MEKDNFLDTNIIFHYSNYTDSSSKIIKKCYFFIINKSGNFILCGAVLKELNEITIKRARVHKAVIEKIKNLEYLFEKSTLLSKQDISFAKQVYEKCKDKSKEEVERLLRIDREFSELKIEKFLQINVDEKVMLSNQINADLVNKIYDIIPNHADSKILASAIQLQSQEERKLFFFVTADKKDLDPNGYEYLKEHFEINYPKENYKFPELLNLMFTN